MPYAKKVTVYLSEEDAVLLRDHMKRTDLSASKLIGRILRTSEVHVEIPAPPPPVQNLEAIRLLSKLSVNVNQIARRMNACKLDPAAIISREEFALINRAMTLAIAYLRGIQNPVEVCEYLGITDWMTRDQAISAAKQARKEGGPAPQPPTGGGA